MEVAQPLSSARSSVCNITGLANFDRTAAAGVFEEIHNSAALFLSHPWNSHVVHTIFGNLRYRLPVSETQFSGVRDASHILALASLVHKGRILDVTLHRFDVDSSLGLYVQVSHCCFMERVGREILGGCLQVVPRTEELANVIILQFPRVRDLVHRAMALGMLPASDAAACEDALWDNARASAQITRIGHVKMRFNWTTPLNVRVETLGDIQAKVKAMCELFTLVLRCLC